MRECAKRILNPIPYMKRQSLKQTRSTQALRKAIVSSGLLQNKDRLLVAVSGGPDSMALLAMLHALSRRHGWSVTVAHLNHRLRGKDSSADEKLVRRWSLKNGLECIAERCDIESYRKAHRMTLEEAARDRRYDFLERIAAATQSDKVILAHTADDQAETVLWRLLRGAVGGLAGMPESRPCGRSRAVFVRPFLAARKSDILIFLKEHRIPYRLDKSNRDIRLTRNRIRLELLPYLQKAFNPDIVNTIAASASILKDQRDFMQQTAKRHAKALLKKSINVSALRRLDTVLRTEILKIAFEKAGGDIALLRQEHLLALSALAKPESVSRIKYWELGGVVARREQKHIRFLNTHRPF